MPEHEHTPPPVPGFIFEHDSARRRVLITLYNKSTVEIWHAAVATIAAANVWRDPVIYDMSAVDSAPLLVNLPNLVPIVAGLHEAHGQREGVAVIVPSSELLLWQQRLEPFRPLLAIEAFADVASAHAWLDGIATTTMRTR